ncbi:MAG: superoxide dismutase [Cu-Zn] SodC [Rubrivivax sp.]
MNRLTLSMTLVAFAVVLASALPLANAAEPALTVTLNEVDAKGIGTAIGTVSIEETRYGLVFQPQLKGLPAGLHGFHVHENPSCAPEMEDGKMVPAKAAGGHLDPSSTKRHGYSWGDGHLGDLPALAVTDDGTATNPVLAPRLRLAEVKGRALMVHVGGDNHADLPKPLGGGGARMACGVIR